MIMRTNDKSGNRIQLSNKKLKEIETFGFFEVLSTGVEISNKKITSGLEKQHQRSKNKITSGNQGKYLD